MVVTVNGNMSEAEKEMYVKMLKDNHPDKIFKTINITVDGEYVDVNYTYDTVPFDRIRRITGYLVGNMSRWNDGKLAEEHDRVKHGVA